jgi:hypothetical protein
MNTRNRGDMRDRRLYLVNFIGATVGDIAAP